MFADTAQRLVSNTSALKNYQCYLRLNYSPSNIKWNMSSHFYCANSFHNIKVCVPRYVEWTITNIVHKVERDFTLLHANSLHNIKVCVPRYVEWTITIIVHMVEHDFTLLLCKFTLC